MTRYGIATLFENYPDGYEFTEASTPLHLTHVDVLEIDLGLEAFIGKMRSFISSQKPFSILPIADTLFGPNKDIPVTLVELNSELKAFHQSLIGFLELNAATFENPHFLKQTYAPHISIYGTRRVEIGKPIAIKNVSIGNKRTDIENPPNRIVATIPLR